MIYRPKIRPKNEFIYYVPFLGLVIWVTFCSNSNTLPLDSNSYKQNNLSGVKCIEIVNSLQLVDAYENYVQNIENPLLYC